MYSKHESQKVTTPVKYNLLVTVINEKTTND